MCACFVESKANESAVSRCGVFCGAFAVFKPKLAAVNANLFQIVVETGRKFTLFVFGHKEEASGRDADNAVGKVVVFCPLSELELDLTHAVGHGADGLCCG